MCHSSHPSSTTCHISLLISQKLPLSQCRKCRKCRTCRTCRHVLSAQSCGEDDGDSGSGCRGGTPWTPQRCCRGVKEILGRTCRGRQGRQLTPSTHETIFWSHLEVTSAHHPGTLAHARHIRSHLKIQCAIISTKKSLLVALSGELLLTERDFCSQGYF